MPLGYLRFFGGFLLFCILFESISAKTCKLAVFGILVLRTIYDVQTAIITNSELIYEDAWRLPEMGKA